jgi:hypothetical protein
VARMGCAYVRSVSGTRACEGGKDRRFRVGGAHFWSLLVRRVSRARWRARALGGFSCAGGWRVSRMRSTIVGVWGAFRAFVVRVLC